ncbi:cell envelope integrity protein CreD [Erwinia sp. S38]|uniref:cell envelope integrity protein CreD n=1 Tax=Erwinia sp. S38 TaxID=2769338 RepID=UPI00190D51CE|nr:cell envelope integrity protein CreD [Erwinia sp. S38]MBK0002559.1 cell envelope integrity protein CreD [Erwinia sp. S38]
MLKSALFWKVITLIGCLLLLLVPLSMLNSLIAERASWRDSVAQTLSQSTSGPQRVLGPLIVVPWTETRKVMKDDKEVLVEEKHHRFYLPEQLKIGAQQVVESRSVGIYQGQLWRSGMAVSASFDGERIRDLLNKPGIVLGQPWLTIVLGDSRGIASVTPLQIEGQELDFQPGSQFGQDGEGLHAVLPQSLLQKKSLALSFSIKLMGTRELEVVPLGKNSAFELQSNWPHPGFTGSFLPEKRQITSQGFTANWQSSWFANNLNSRFSDDAEVRSATLPAFSSMVINPVDQYQLTDRAVKYAILLIGLTFMAFFLFETLTALRVHPMQYLLVGLSLVMFFLVLLALSEHIGFNLAWLSASLTCAAINGFYLQAVLQGWRRSLSFVAGLLVLDAVLWQLLQSEDSALLLGTGVLAIALAAVMVLTRHIDWYGLSMPTAKKAVQGAEKDDKEPDDRFRLWK